MSENLYGQNKPQGQSQQPGQDQNSQNQGSQAQQQYQGQVPQSNSSQQGNYQGNGAQNSYQQQYPQQPQQSASFLRWSGTKSAAYSISRAALL